MTYRFARTRSFVSSSRRAARAGARAWSLHIVVVSALTLVLAGCAPAPFNISLLLFLPSDSLQGVYGADLAPIDVGPLASELPHFSLHQIPLSTVQIPFELNTPASPEGIQTARAELTLISGVSPPGGSLEALADCLVTLYIAPGTTEDRFSPLYAVPLGRAALGSATEIALTGELTSDQLEFLGAGSLHVGLEFSETEVSLSNTGAETASFEGFTWEVIALRVRGTATFSL